MLCPKSSLSQLLEQIAKANPNLSVETFELIKTLLSDKDSNVRSSVCRVLIEIAEDNLNLSTECLELIKTLLSDEDKYVREAACSALVALANANPNLSKEVLELIKPLLSDEDKYVREAACSTLRAVAEANPNLSGESRKLIEPLLSDKDSDVREAAYKALVEIVKANPNLSKEILELIKILLSDEDRFVQSIACSALREMVKANPNLSKEILELIKILLSDEDWFVQSIACSALREMVKANPNLSKEILELIKILLSDEDWFVQSIACSALREMVKANPNLSKEILELIKILLSDEDWFVQKETCSFSTAVANFALRLALSDSMFGSEGFSVQKEICSALVALANANPNLSKEVLELIKPLLSDEDKYVRSAACKALVEIAKANPTKEAFQLIKPLLSEHGFCRKEACSAIVEIVKANPSLAEEFFELIPLLYNTGWSVREAACKALIEMAKANPAEACTLVNNTLLLHDKELTNIVEKIIKEQVSSFLDRESFNITTIKTLQNLLKSNLPSLKDFSIRSIKSYLPYMQESDISFSDKLFCTIEILMNKDILEREEKYGNEDAKEVMLTISDCLTMITSNTSVSETYVEVLNNNFESLVLCGEEVMSNIFATMINGLSGNILGGVSQFIGNCCSYFSLSFSSDGSVTFNNEHYIISDSLLFDRLIGSVIRAIYGEDPCHVLATNLNHFDKHITSAPFYAIQYGVSIVDDERYLEYMGEWYISSFSSSEMQTLFIVCEGRDSFGNVVIYKITQDSMVSFKLAPNVYGSTKKEELAGLEERLEIKKTIFETDQEYQFTSFTIDHETGYELLEKYESIYSGGDTVQVFEVHTNYVHNVHNQLEFAYNSKDVHKVIQEQIKELEEELTLGKRLEEVEHGLKKEGFLLNTTPIDGHDGHVINDEEGVLHNTTPNSVTEDYHSSLNNSHITDSFGV